STGSWDDDGILLAPLEDGGVYITGTFESPATFGETVLTPAGGKDFYIAKYDANGHLSWAKSEGGTDNDQSKGGVFALPDGSLYVAGYFKSPQIFGDTTAASDAYDGFLAKYDSSGNRLWVRTQLDGGNNSLVRVLSDGSAYMRYGARGEGSNILAKYGPDGTIAWTREVGAPDGVLVRVLDDGSAFVSGGFADSLSIGDTTLTPDGARNLFLAKYDVNGDAVWAKNLGGVSGALTTLGGAAYVSGGFTGSISIGGTTLNATHTNDLFLAKYDAAGDLVWAKDIGGSNDPFGAAIDGLGSSLYLRGSFEGALGIGSSTLNSAGGRDGLVAKLDSEGVFGWVDEIGGANDEAPRVLCPAPDGSLYVLSSSQSNVQTGEDTLSTTGYSLSRYDAEGSSMSVRAAGLRNAEQDSRPSSLGVNQAGALFVTGYFDTRVRLGSLDMQVPAGVAGNGRGIFVARQ
ncbi:MAG: hypothetical protein RL033_4971, partial [Pseudomonadota bacterium]